MSNVPKRIGILLTSSPEHQNSYTVCRLTEALLDQGHTIQLFLMDDGIYNVVKNAAKEKLFSAFDLLMARGATIQICALSAEMRAVPPDALLAGVGPMSQYELSEIVSKADRFLTFVP